MTEVAMGPRRTFDAKSGREPNDRRDTVLNVSGFNPQSRRRGLVGRRLYDTADAQSGLPGPCGTEGPVSPKRHESLADFIECARDCGSPNSNLWPMSRIHGASTTRISAHP